ncbi:MAG: N-acetylmuramoyl-L-alanine amidase [Actinomycetia bacterium]|nr:N-acetylmuramoyl-L-alanine amidase [Actinomycetes bacterium]
MADSALCSTRIITGMCTPTNGRAVNLVALHTLEYPERSGAARWAAQYFQTVQASANYITDAEEIVGNVWEKDMPWTTPGVNERSISIEQAGYAGQSATEWADAYSRAMLENSARLTADICLRNGITPRRLTDAQLAAGVDGIIDHVQASRVYRQSDHWDCGDNFPWAYFMSRVAHYYGGGTGGLVPAAPTPDPTNILEYIMTLTESQAKTIIREQARLGCRDAYLNDAGFFQQQAFRAVQQNAGFLRGVTRDGARLANQTRFSTSGLTNGHSTSVEAETAWAAANHQSTRAQITALEKKIDALTAQLATLTQKEDA